MSTAQLRGQIDGIIKEIGDGIRDLDQVGMLIDMESNQVASEFDTGDQDFQSTLRKTKDTVANSVSDLKAVCQSLENVKSAL